MGRGGKSSGDRLVSLAELKSHGKPGDCWFAIEGKVYDVSKWDNHPGGRVLFSVAGTDATDSFRVFHTVPEASRAQLEAKMESFCIGTLDGAAAKSLAPTPFEQEYRDLYVRVKNDPAFSQAK